MGCGGTPSDPHVLHLLLQHLVASPPCLLLAPSFLLLLLLLGELLLDGCRLDKWYELPQVWGDKEPLSPHPRQGAGDRGAQEDVTWGHEVLELLRDADALRGLVVLQDGADGAGGSTHGGIQHVHKFYLWEGDTGDICDMGKAKGTQEEPPHAHQPHLVHHLLGLAIADAQAPGLVVCAVGTGDELAEGARAGEPGLQIQLFAGRMVQGAWRGDSAEWGVPLPS